MQSDEILFDVKGGTGVITLNRPQALNALNLTMIRLMNPKLESWAKDPSVHAVVITGAGDRAFCAGGDVKAVAQDGLAAKNGQGDGALARDFFREEYILNNRIYSFPKPYVSLINGIVMGGGKGLSAHGSHRVVSEKVQFAMPETNIGFFPDVGGGYFLPRCPGQTGVYLAMTSKRIGAADTAYIGFATHYVPSDKMPDLLTALTSIAWDKNTSAKDQVNAVLAKFTGPAAGVSELEANRAAIDRCFGHNRVEDIVDSLKKEASPFGEETLKAMSTMSPTSLKIALRQIRLGANMPFAQVMTMEYRLSQACMKGRDFYEGIRAALIDKDRQPKWSPANVADVQDNEVESYFQSLGDKDLIF